MARLLFDLDIYFDIYLRMARLLFDLDLLFQDQHFEMLTTRKR